MYKPLYFNVIGLTRCEVWEDLVRRQGTVVEQMGEDLVRSLGTFQLFH